MSNIENLTTIEVYTLYTLLFEEITRYERVLEDTTDTTICTSIEHELSILKPLYDKIDKALDTALDNM